MDKIFILFILGGCAYCLRIIKSLLLKKSNEIEIDNTKFVILLITLFCSIFGFMNNYCFLDIFGATKLSDMPEGKYKAYISLIDSNNSEYVFPCTIFKYKEPDGMEYYLDTLPLDEDYIIGDYVDFTGSYTYEIYDKKYDFYLIDSYCSKDSREIETKEIIYEWIDFIIYSLCFACPLLILYTLTKKYLENK